MIPFSFFLAFPKQCHLFRTFNIVSHSLRLCRTTSPYGMAKMIAAARWTNSMAPLLPREGGILKSLLQAQLAPGKKILAQRPQDAVQHAGSLPLLKSAVICS